MSSHVATRLDGRAVAARLKAELAERVQRLRDRGTVPGLGTLLVGDDPGSQIYVAGKHRDCAEVGIASVRVDLPATASKSDVRAAIDRLNADERVSAYIVQLPLPAQIDPVAALERIDPAKDADGLHPVNLGRLVLDTAGPTSETAPGDRLASPLPCTPAGIIELLRRYDVPLAGADVCVIGAGVTVGRPLALMLAQRAVGATVDLLHSGTRDVAAHVRRADVVVAAAGSAHLVRPDWVKPGAAVVDVGITRVQREDGRSRQVGDVDPAVADVAGWLTPNPGGVGPMTRVMLLENVVRIAEAHSAS